MLTRMYLTNFLSFSERTEFDFTASKYSILGESNVYDNSILKGALFVEPNASGKSNALKGIVFLLKLIKEDGASFEHHRCTFGKTPLTTVEYEFVINQKKVVYKIEYNVKTKGISEDLTIDNITVLKRSGTTGELIVGEELRVKDSLDRNTLFLRTASFDTGRFPEEPTLRALMDFLLNSYYIDGYNQGAHWGTNIMQYAEEHGVDKVNQYLKDFNYDFFVEYGSESEGEGLKVSVGSNKKMVFLKRKTFPVPNIFFEESQGNQVFTDMLPHIIRVIEAPGLLVFDEFGNSLHNRLAEKIIKFFMKNGKNSQLFVTSHHTNLISNYVLRPDQIHLITFKDAKGSKVERISRFKPREAQNMEKMYLGGMSEGLPLYEEV